MTELQTQKNEVRYKSGNDEITLTPGVVEQFVTKGNGKISTEEAFNFIQLCRYNGLNPFLNEAYIIKFGNQPAQLIVSKDAFMKRAERQDSYQGFEAGVIVYNPDKQDLVEREGALSLPNEQIIGGWSKVYRSDRERPIVVKINFSEFAKYKDGRLQSTWANMPANMIRKSAIVNALREAYPDQLSAMYTEDEPNIAEIEAKRVDVTPSNDKTQELLSNFKHSEPTPEPKEEIVNEVPKTKTVQPDQEKESLEQFFEKQGELVEPEYEQEALFDEGKVKSKLER